MLSIRKSQRRRFSAPLLAVSLSLGLVFSACSDAVDTAAKAKDESAPAQTETLQPQAPDSSLLANRPITGTPPQPGDPGLMGVGLIYIKDWDRMQEYEQSIAALTQEYNIQIFNQMLPFNVSDDTLVQPDRVDLFYAQNPEDLQRIFQDPRLLERIEFRDEFATDRVVFITGASIWPVDNQPIPPAR